MTRDEIIKADADTLNRLAAVEVMGWYNDRIANRYTSSHDVFNIKRSYAKWHPATDHNDAATVQAEIERRGLSTRFAACLAAVVFEQPYYLTCNDSSDDRLTFNDVGAILNASPEQKTRAALLAVLGEKGGK